MNESRNRNPASQKLSQIWQQSLTPVDRTTLRSHDPLGCHAGLCRLAKPKQQQHVRQCCNHTVRRCSHGVHPAERQQRRIRHLPVLRWVLAVPVESDGLRRLDSGGQGCHRAAVRNRRLYGLSMQRSVGSGSRQLEHVQHRRHLRVRRRSHKLHHSKPWRRFRTLSVLRGLCTVLVESVRLRRRRTDRHGIDRKHLLGTWVHLFSVHGLGRGRGGPFDQVQLGHHDHGDNQDEGRNRQSFSFVCRCARFSASASPGPGSGRCRRQRHRHASLLIKKQ
jgi:hypothetical protein